HCPTSRPRSLPTPPATGLSLALANRPARPDPGRPSRMTTAVGSPARARASRNETATARHGPGHPPKPAKPPQPCPPGPPGRALARRERAAARRLGRHPRAELHRRRSISTMTRDIAPLQRYSAILVLAILVRPVPS